jgi:hypothetical protein
MHARVDTRHGALLRLIVGHCERLNRALPVFGAQIVGLALAARKTLMGFGLLTQPAA